MRPCRSSLRTTRSCPTRWPTRSRSRWWSRSTYRTRSPGWSPTTPATSPASCCRSTPATRTRSERGNQMAGRVAGKVAFITGAARSQGRSHAVRLAEEGADIIAVDIAAPVESVTAYPGPTEEELAETVKLVEALDRRIVAHKADVRN